MDAPLRWITPSRLDPADPRVATGGFILRTETRLAPWSSLVVSRAGSELHRQRLVRGATPNRTLRLSAAWTTRVRAEDRDAGPVRISVER